MSIMFFDLSRLRDVTAISSKANGQLPSTSKKYIYIYIERERERIRAWRIQKVKKGATFGS